MLRLLCCILLTSIAQASTPIFQSSFQNSDHGWTAVRGTATADSVISHDKRTSLRVERDGVSQDAYVHSTPVTLVIGKRYELSGWIHTESLQVHDVDRSPIASGATLTMASMPFDVHSVSIAGTQPWTQVMLPFVASRSQDQILLTAGNGGSFSGKAWFEAFVCRRPVPTLTGR
jgi:hypothetical protein